MIKIWEIQGEFIGCFINLLLLSKCIFLFKMDNLQNNQYMNIKN